MLLEYAMFIKLFLNCTTRRVLSKGHFVVFTNKKHLCCNKYFSCPDIPWEKLFSVAAVYR